MMVWSGCLAALHLVCLWALLPLDDVELDLIAFFQRFVSIELDRAVVHEDVGPIISSDETIALRVVEPLDLAFVLGHVSVTSLQSRFERATRGDRQRVVCCSVAGQRVCFVLGGLKARPASL